MDGRTNRGGAARPDRRAGVEPLEPRFLLAAELVADLNLALGNSVSITEIMDGGGGLGYVACIRPGGSGGQLWRVDGTQAGTGPLVDLSVPPWLIGAAGGAFYFTVDGQGVGRELWRTDGTPAGTFLLKDIYPGSLSSNPSWIGRLGARMVFGASDPEHGRELWITDGTAEGTSLLADVLPGAGHGVGGLTGPPLPDGSLFFWGNDGVHRGLFRTDGTAEGTRPAGEVVPGGVPAALSYTLGVLDGAIYFGGDAGVHGVELFRLDDCFAPAVLETASDAAVEASGPAIRFRFGEDVGASLGPDDLLLTNLTTGQVVAADSVAVTYDPGTHTATFYPAGAGTWPDGRYRAVLRATGVADAAGNALASDAVAEFTLLVGGGDFDGRVDAADYYRIDRGRALGLTGWENGDFNGDGSAGDPDDYLRLDAEFMRATGSGQAITGPRAAPGPTPFAAAAPAIAPPADDEPDDEEEGEDDGILA